MTFDQWKELLAKDRPAACRALFRADYEIDGEDAIDYTPEDLAEDLEKIHAGLVRPFHLRTDAELIELAEDVFGDDDLNDPPASVTILEVQYRCPQCGQHWQEESTSACDSECPKCECDNITALSWKELN